MSEPKYYIFMILATMIRENLKETTNRNKDENVFLTVLIGFLNIKERKGDEKGEISILGYI